MLLSKAVGLYLEFWKEFTGKVCHYLLTSVPMERWVEFVSPQSISGVS